MALTGIAITLVVCSHENVRNIGLIQSSIRGVEPKQATESRSRLWSTSGVLLGLIVVCACCFATANYYVEAHRHSVFRKLAQEQVDVFGPRIETEISKRKGDPNEKVSTELHALLKTLEQFSFINRATLYIPDPKDEHALWGLTAWRSYNERDRFSRFYVSKPFEKSILLSLTEGSEELASINSSPKFEYYHLLVNKYARPIAVLRIDGNPASNFRQYGSIF